MTLFVVVGTTRCGPAPQESSRPRVVESASGTKQVPALHGPVRNGDATSSVAPTVCAPVNGGRVR